jgi:hypothetical protein
MSALGEGLIQAIDLDWARLSGLGSDLWRFERTAGPWLMLLLMLLRSRSGAAIGHSLGRYVSSPRAFQHEVIQHPKHEEDACTAEEKQCDGSHRRHRHCKPALYLQLDYTASAAYESDKTS